MPIKLDTSALYVGQEVKIVSNSGMHFVKPNTVAIIGYVGKGDVTVIAQVIDDRKIAPQIVDIKDLRHVGTSQASKEVYEYYASHRKELWSDYL